MKMPLSLPEICIGNHKSVAQSCTGLPLALHRSNCTVKMCTCVSFLCECVCDGRNNTLMGRKRFHLVSIVILTVTVTKCLVNFTARNQKINDPQQVAKVLNGHLMNALSC